MDLEISSGDLLISPPGIPDTRFSKAVMMIVSHDEDHTMAICMNRLTDYTLNKIVNPLGLHFEEDIEVYWGGPVSMQTVWMIHESSWATDNTVKINDHWAITSQESMFHNMADGNFPERFRLFLGHAGWGSGQLEMELRGVEPWNHKHSWLVLKDPNPDWLVNDDVDRLWSTATGLCSQQTVSHWLE